ncbi:hypothetical protein BJY01DRAFT_238090 [Aspergillus pseudoustus]|uniref:Ribosomal RNA methyltransferase FtsJ domain-containing protein n=1 Tax=Aspergillus pseudoustus TaxID=1810923 RepID=A0ABR4JD04_9EURO
MTQNIGNDLAAATGILEFDCPCPRILDLCMAPGGFSSTARKYLPNSVINAITLPVELGGYQVMVDGIQDIRYADITMYVEEMVPGEGAPVGHPDAGKFNITRPFLQSQYDIVFCGGAVGKNHPREEYRNDCEGSRLTSSQMVFALGRLKPGGSLVLLLHRVESWDTVCVLHAFNQFSDIQLFKHPVFHAITSSFYMVARNINLEHGTVKHLIHYWRSLWKYLTFKEFSDIVPPSLSLYEPEPELVRQLQDGFGGQFTELARPVWTIQAKALRAQHFTHLF